MPTGFKTIIDLKLTNCGNTFRYLNELLIVTKGSKETHKDYIKYWNKRQKLSNIFTQIPKLRVNR